MPDESAGPDIQDPMIGEPESCRDLFGNCNFILVGLGLDFLALVLAEILRLRVGAAVASLVLDSSVFPIRSTVRTIQSTVNHVSSIKTFITVYNKKWLPNLLLLESGDQYALHERGRLERDSDIFQRTIFQPTLYRDFN